MKYLLSITFLCLAVKLNAQNVVLNELVARNVITLQQNCERGGCADLIELRNTTNSAVDISGYFISDDVNDTMRFQIPAGTTIPANGFLLLFGEDGFTGTSSIRVNFNLASTGETVILSDASGTEIQRITYPAIQNDISYGRLNDGTYSLMSTPTPRIANLDNTAFEYLNSNLTVSVPSGVYSSAQTVELISTGTGNIFFTLDGTTPTSSSTPYTGPITITTNTALKAIVIESSNAFSIVENRSYIIGATHDLPIILLTSDNSVREASRRNKEVIDGRVEFNFIETDGSTVISQYANFRESGTTSRFVIPQLNGKIVANSLYGDADFDHKIFPNKEIDEFGSIYLRNSSQDWFYTHLRDAFISRITSVDNLVDFPFEGYRPAVLYVNAIYQGIINIREDDDNDYVRHNFNLNNDDFVLAGRRSGFIDPNSPLPNDRNALDPLINFNNYTNIRILFNYTNLSEVGFGSWEDISGKTGQRYNYFIHDYDFSLGRLSFLGVVDLPDPMEINNLLDDEIDAVPEFRAESLQFVAAAMNHLYNTERTLSILDDMQAELESEIPAHAAVNERLNSERTPPFGNPPFFNITEWRQNMSVLRTNTENRIDADIFNRLQSEYTLGAPIQVNYNTSDISQGFIRVHDIRIQDQNASGTYFSNMPVILTAEALPGFRFLRWEGDVTSTSTIITPTFSNNASVTAVFEPVTFIPNAAVINEIQGRNNATIADENGEFDDWIEIYNPTSSPIDLAGLFISDNLSDPLKFQIPNTNPSLTTVPANGYLLLWADNDLNQGENHLGFTLRRSDQVILTYPDGVTEKQRVEYDDVTTDNSFGAETDGDTNFVEFIIPTPNASNNGSTLSTSDFEKNEFFAYPNPTDSEVTINTPSSGTKLDWQVYSITGALLNTGTGNIISFEGMSSGLYFVRLNNNFTIKIIKR